MAVSLDGLNQEFRAKIDDLVGRLRGIGVEMRPYFALRSPAEQASLWRQSRSTEEISAAVKRLQDAGAQYLAKVLCDVGPCHGMHVTNSLPGLSWHQWGEAVDCFWAVNGKAEWSSSIIIDGVNGYVMMANEAEKIGLTAGGRWPKFKDWPHVQMRVSGSPIAEGMTLQEIDHEMQQRFE